MDELLLFKSDKLKINAMMIGMTTETLLTFYRGKRMISLANIPALLDFSMTIKTFLTGDLLS